MTRRPGAGHAVSLVCLALLTAILSASEAHASALQATVTGYQRAGAAVRVHLELRDVLTDRWRRAVDGGATLYVRMEAELWEKRGVLDRLVRRAAVSVARITSEGAGRAVVLVDAFGHGESYPLSAPALAVWADLVPVAQVEDGKQYYAHVRVVVGTIAEGQISGVSDAVFGQSSGGLGGLGRLVLQKVLRLADYLDSASCEATSAPVRGAAMKTAARP